MYQVCTKDEYTDTWHLVEINDINELKAAILDATKTGREIRISIPMEFSIDVTVSEEIPPLPVKKEKALTPSKKRWEVVKEHEVTESGSEKDQGSGDQSNSSV